MPSKKSQAPSVPAVPGKEILTEAPDNLSQALKRLSESTKAKWKSGEEEKLSTEQADEDMTQGCFNAQVAHLLLREASQKTAAGQKRRQEALDCGVIDVALRCIRSGDAAIAEPCAGIINALIRDIPASRERILAPALNGVGTLWNAIEAGNPSTSMSITDSLDCLMSESDNCWRVLRALESAKWDRVAAALVRQNWADSAIEGQAATASSPVKAATAVLHLAVVLLCPHADPLKPSTGSTMSSKSEKPPGQGATLAPAPGNKPAGKGKAGRVADSGENSRQVLLSNAAQSDILLSALLQICQEELIDAKGREAAVAVIHAVLLGHHWPTHHACLTGEGCSGLVSVMSAGDVSFASKSLAAATLNEFLLPPTAQQAEPPAPTASADALELGAQATSAKGKASKKKDPREPAGPQANTMPAALPPNVLLQAMDRISVVIEAGALPVLTNLLAGPLESKAKNVINVDIEALQLEALSCLRTLSLLDEGKRLLAESGYTKAFLPLLTSKKDVIRWMSRQVLLNTATLEEAAERMEADGAPAHIHGMNLVRLRRSHSQAKGSSPLLLELQAKLHARYSQA